MTYEFDTETLDLPGAEVVNYNVHDGSHYITVQFDSSCNETSYIIGQFRGGGCRVLNIDFEQNKAQFIKDTDA